MLLRNQILYYAEKVGITRTLGMYGKTTDRTNRLANRPNKRTGASEIQLIYSKAYRIGMEISQLQMYYIHR